MIEAFKVIRFNSATLALIGHANEIIGEYQALGFTLTLRQLFYQFVSRPALGLANTFDNYKKRRKSEAGRHRRPPGRRIDWDALEDRTRNVRSLPTWDEPPEIIGACANQYREDIWSSQPYRPEVWIEKDALTGVIEGVSEEFRVPWFSCRGNVSDSEMYAAGKRFAAVIAQGQVPLVLQLVPRATSRVTFASDVHGPPAMKTRPDVGVRRLTLPLARRPTPPPNLADDWGSTSSDSVRPFGATGTYASHALSPTGFSRLVRRALDRMVGATARATENDTRDDQRSVVTPGPWVWSLVKSAP